MYTPVFSLLGTLQYNQYKTGVVSNFFQRELRKKGWATDVHMSLSLFEIHTKI